jgi:putative ABC transport system substrate-binding protein
MVYCADGQLPMRRRTFVAALGVVAAVGPFTVRAEQEIRRIGYLGLAPAAEARPSIEAFEAGLREFGHVPGKTYEIEWRIADGQEDRMPRMAKELVDLKVEVILTAGRGTVAAYAATKTIPIVAAVGGDLVGSGFAASIAHPGGNVTGLEFFVVDLTVKLVEFLRLIQPAMTDVGVLLPQGYGTELFRVMDARAKALGVNATQIEVIEPSDCDRVLSAGRGASIVGLVVPDYARFNVEPWPGTIAAAALRRRLPAAGGSPFARKGGLLGYSVDFDAMYGRAAIYVDKILKGAKPGDLPIEQASKFHFVVNLKTASALGLGIPPTLLAAANEVIE